MGTPATVATVLRTQGLQFVRLFQGALRLVTLYSTEHTQARAAIERAMLPLTTVLKETPTLSVGFQFDNVVLNSVPVQDPTLSPLAGELVKRRVGFLVFSEGITAEALSQMLEVLGTKPDVIEQQGGLHKFLMTRPLEHARIVPIQMAAADGSLAVVTSAEEAAAMAKIPRWLLRALQDVHESGGGQLIGALELTALAESMSPDLTPEQRVLIPQLQGLLVRVVQRANTTALAEFIRTAATEMGGAREELLQSVLLQGLTGALAAGEEAQAERILRSVDLLKLEPESLLLMVPDDKVPPDMKDRLLEYADWLAHPQEEQVADVSQRSTARHFRWLVLEIEHHVEESRRDEACDLLLVMFTAKGPSSEPERAEILTRGRHLLAEICSAGLPPNVQQFMNTVTQRVREETSAVIATPLIESLTVLIQTAAERHDYALAATGAAVIAEISEEFSARGRIARQAQSELLKPSTVAELVRTCIGRKDDPTVNRAILPLLKKVGDQAARELLAMLEKEQVAARRMRILQFVKLLGKSAADALAEKLSDPHWYVVRNAVTAIGELADPSLIDRMEPALSHADERVQQAAVSATLKTRSPHRALPLARALPVMKPAILETVLDDLLVLKAPETVPHLEVFLRASAESVRPNVLQKAVAALWSIGTDEAARALVNTVLDAGVPMPARLAALRAVARLSPEISHPALHDVAANVSDQSLAQEARTLLG